MQDIVYTDKTGEQYLAAPGQCFPWSDEFGSSLRNGIGGVWIYNATQDPLGGLYCHEVMGYNLDVDIELYAGVEAVLDRPIHQAYAPTAATYARRLLNGSYDAPVFKQELTAADFRVMYNDATPLFHMAREKMPHIYVGHSAETEKIFGTQNVVTLWDGALKKFRDFVRTPFPVLHSPWAVLARKVGANAKTALQDWGIANFAAGQQVGTCLFIGFDPDPNVNTPQRLLTRAEYEAFRPNGYTTCRYAFNVDCRSKLGVEELLEYSTGAIRSALKYRTLLGSGVMSLY